MIEKFLTIDQLADKYGKQKYQVRYLIKSTGLLPLDPSTKPLKYNENAFLEATGKAKKLVLEELKELNTSPHPKLGLQVGDKVSRDYLIENYWGFQSGISYSLREKDVTLVITKADSEEKKQYEDFFDTEEQVFKYYGEGRIGDMSLQSIRNRRLLHHLKTKKPVDVYSKVAVKQHIFFGRFWVTDVNAVKAPDVNGDIRLAYLFTLKPLTRGEDILMNPKTGEKFSPTKDPFQKLKDIQNLVNEDADSGKAKKRLTNGYKRNKQLVNALKEWYEYKCQLCDPQNPIPRIPTKNKKFYVEVHHCTGMAEAMNIPPGGNQDEGDFLVDHYQNLITVCGHHHDVLHYYKEEFTYNVQEKAFVANDGTTLPVYLLHKEHELGK